MDGDTAGRAANGLSQAADTQLLQQIGALNTAAMEVFYKRHASAVYAFAFRRLQDAALADEVTNDTLHQVWLSAASFAAQSSVKTWVLGIAKNKMLDSLRSRGRLEAREQEVDNTAQENWVDEAPCAYAKLLGKQQGEHLLHCFEKLPNAQQTCLHLSFVEGMTQSEIADVMTVPANTIATRLHHAKRKLRECMEAIFGEGEVL